MPKMVACNSSATSQILVLCEDIHVLFLTFASKNTRPKSSELHSNNMVMCILVTFLNLAIIRIYDIYGDIFFMADSLCLRSGNVTAI